MLPGRLASWPQKAACLFVLLWHAPAFAGAPLPGFGEEFLTVPATINTAADTACLDIGYIVSDYDCTDVPSNTADIQVKHCTTGGSKSAGVFIFQRQPLHPRRWPDVYRLRMVGREIKLLPMHYCRNGMALAPYSVALNGTYHFEALHLFSGFSYDKHPHILDEASVSLAQLTLTLTGTEFAMPPRTDCAWDGGCPACTDSRAAGRWIVKDPAGLRLETSCIVTPSMRTKDGNPVCGDRKLHVLATTWQSAQGLAYQPYNCRMRSENEIDRVACIANRLMCFVGDSQMRHAHNGVSHLLKGSLEWHGAPGAKKTDKSIMQGDYTKFFNYNYGEMTWNASECTDIIINFGQWMMAAELQRPKSIHEYVSKLRDTIGHLLTLRQSGKRIFWVTTNTFPIWRGAWYNPKRQEWRTDPNLLLYNRAANKMMEDAGIPIIDIYSISSPLNDMSYDASHYLGHVGYNMDLRILNALCPPPQPAGPAGAAAI